MNYLLDTNIVSLAVKQNTNKIYRYVSPPRNDI
jgi:hypothetical protein